MGRVLITGGSSGIGLACGRRLAADGARAALLARPGADVRDAGELDEADYRETIETTLLGALNAAHAALPHLERSRGTLVFVGSVAGRVPTPWLASYAAAKHGVRGFARSLAAELRAQRVPVRVALVQPGPVDTPFWRRARTADRRRPPKLVGAYRADDVAREVARALASPRPERMVGGLTAAWALADALAPNLSVRITGPVARLGWRRREHVPAQAAGALRILRDRLGARG